MNEIHGNVAVMLEVINAYDNLVGNPEGKKPLKRPRHRWENNIKMDRKIGFKVLRWIHLAQDNVQ
jgi:hypothetical protein